MFLFVLVKLSLYENIKEILKIKSWKMNEMPVILRVKLHIDYMHLCSGKNNRLAYIVLVWDSVTLI